MLRKPKYVGDSSATMSPGLVTARRHSVMASTQPFVMTMSRASIWQPMRRPWRAMARRSVSSPPPMGYVHRLCRLRWAARLTARRTRSCENSSALGQAAPKDVKDGSLARRSTWLRE